MRARRGRCDQGEGLVPADEDGLAGLVLELGTEVKALRRDDERRGLGAGPARGAGWLVEVAHAGKVRDVAPLACKTDKVDARVLAELCRRDLVPAVWVPSPEDRAIRERLRRRAHLVKPRTSARNRIFGLLTQFGLRISHARLRKADAMELLESRGVPEVWRDSIAELLELAAEMHQRIDPIDRELGPIAAQTSGRGCCHDPWRRPAAQPHLRRRDRRGLALCGARKLIGYAGLAPRVIQSGERSATGALSKAGSRTLRWAAVEAANQAWRPSSPFHGHYLRVSARHGKNPAKSAVARKLLIAPGTCSRAARPSNQPAPANSRCFLTA